jgi:hypothetical protein
VRDCDAPIFSHVLEPFFVRAGAREQIVVTLDFEPGGGKRSWKLLAQVSVGKENKAQAARS